MSGHRYPVHNVGMVIRMKGLGAEIREAREAKGWTQDELARLIGMREKDVSRWENGHHEPSLPSYFKLCEVLERHLGLGNGSGPSSQKDAQTPILYCAYIPRYQRRRIRSGPRSNVFMVTWDHGEIRRSAA